MKRLFAALAFSALMFAPASAQDENKSWTGLYVGIHGGLDATSIGGAAGPFGIDGLSANGAAFGIHGGYDWQLPGSPLVIGIGADYTWSSAEFSAHLGPNRVTAGIEDSGSVYGKIGLSLGDVLPYAIAGYSWADAKASLAGNSASTDLEGWLLGGGVEFRLASNVTLAGEYRYTKFDDVSLGAGASLEPERHEVRAALKYRFSPF